MASRTTPLIVSLASSGSQLRARRGKAAQRSLASVALERAFGGAPSAEGASRLNSISHSRGVALAAVMAVEADGFDGRLGCDVECADAPRRWGEIGAFLTGEPFTGAPALACRAWTLAEAWFKAFQAWPVAALVRRGLAQTDVLSEPRVIALASSVYWYGFAPIAGFQASIVWRGDEVSPLVLFDAHDGGATSGPAP